MTDGSGCRLRALLPQHMDDMTDELRRNLDDAVGKGDGGSVYAFLGSQTIDVIDDALDVDVFEILARAWSVARELGEFSDETKHPRDETKSVTLGKHDFTTTLHPVLTYRVGNLPTHSLEFTLEFTAQITSVKLDIRNRHLVAVGVAEGRVSAQLKYGKVPLHKKLESQSVQLLGRYQLRAPGFEVARAKA